LTVLERIPSAYVIARLRLVMRRASALELRADGAARRLWYRPSILKALEAGATISNRRDHVEQVAR
jgi:hypothetical protein